jgi:alanyl-tRNA synthetase
VCGQRAVRTARLDYGLLAKASAPLSIGPAELPQAVERMQAEGKASAKERQKLREELAGYQASSLIAEEAVQDGLRVVQRKHADRDPASCKLLASLVAAASAQTLALIASTQQEPATVVMSSSKGLSFSCSDLLRAELGKLGLRGGGSPDMAQGQVPRQQLDVLLADLIAAARAGK